MDCEWEIDRAHLFFLMRDKPDWSNQKLADETKYSLSWVKKWRTRWEHTQEGLDMFKSRSRAPKTRPNSVSKLVVSAILSYRDDLREEYNRVPGALPIIERLHKNEVLKEQGYYLPRSTRTVWRILQAGGRIPTKIKDHHPVERPEPLSETEIDFGQVGKSIEFMSAVDRGTSILVDTQAKEHYTAESAIEAVIEMFVKCDLPQKIWFDRDTRFVGAGMAGYPSTFIRMLWCLGVEPVILPPRRPDLKGFVERSIKTLKHECLYLKCPENDHQATTLLEEYRWFYNHKRAHQGSACGNKPPYEAFPTLPHIRRIPHEVNPDAWVKQYHHKRFKRRVGQNGSVSLGNYNYYVGIEYVGKAVHLQLDAEILDIQAFYRGTPLKRFKLQGLVGKIMDFHDYVGLLLAEARSDDEQIRLLTDK